MTVAQVYILVSESGAVKIGASVSPESRRGQCGSYGFGKCRLVYATDTHRDAYRVEARAHRLLRKFRIEGTGRREWFKVPVKQAREAVDQAVALIEAERIADEKWQAELAARPKPPEPCKCIALHPLTCAQAREVSETEPCDCKCHLKWSERYAT